MILLDFKTTPQKAFVEGFYKGLGAPYVLFGTFDAMQIPAFEPIQLPVRDVNRVFHGDLQRIGGDISTAMRRYAETTGK